MEGEHDRRALALGLVGAATGAPFAALAMGCSWFVGGPAALLLAVGASHAAGVWLPRWTAALSAAAITASLVVANQLDEVAFHWFDDTVFYLVAVGGACAAGAAVTTRARQVRRLEQLHAELLEQQRAETAAARLEEQNRVHHEVHTRLAERIAAVAVRAEGALTVGERAVLPALETEARAVLDQLRSALGSMRTSLPVPAEPTPSDTSVAPSAAVRRRLVRADLVLALVIGTAMAVETSVASGARGPVALNVVVTLAASAPLVVRRRHPVVSSISSLAVACVMSLWLTPLPTTVTGLALVAVISYTVGAWCGREWSIAWVAVAAGTVVVVLLVDAQPEPGLVGGVLVLSLVAVAMGRVAAGWQARARRTEAVVEELERGRGAAVQLALARGREALAGHLHDTVAHAMTVVCLHASAGSRGNGDVSEALRTIATTAETSLAELRDGIEAFESVEHPLDPTRIAALGRRTGVDLVLVGSPPDCDAAGLAYRVVREGIVNVARHAPGARAVVTLSHDSDALAVEVRDTGSAEAPVLVGTGTGLTGLAQAVEMSGGTMTWGRRDDGCFVVAARIPARIPSPVPAGTRARRPVALTAEASR